MTTPTASQTSQKPVLVVDYGAQYAQLIARRVREANVYSEVVPHTYSTEQLLAKNPAAIILSGGPASVYAEGAPSVGAELFEAGIPVFGICYGLPGNFQGVSFPIGQGPSLPREYLLRHLVDSLFCSHEISSPSAHSSLVAAVISS